MLYIYIYLNNLLNNSTYGKGKNPCKKFEDKNIQRITGEKKNIYWKKKKRANLVTPIEKINRYAIDWSKEKTTINCCKATGTKSAQY